MHMIATWLLLRVIIMYKSFKLLFYGCMRKGSGHVHSLWYCPGFVFIKCSAFLHILLLLVHPSLVNLLNHSTASQWSFFFACLNDSIWVYLCPGSSHYPGAAHWSVVCHLQHQVPSSRPFRKCPHWEEDLADLWRSEGVSDPCVSGAVLVCVQILPL